MFMAGYEYYSDGNSPVTLENIKIKTGNSTWTLKTLEIELNNTQCKIDDKEKKL
jgi:hypothetical protein